MFRRWMSRILQAGLDPPVVWPDPEPASVVARISVETPRALWGTDIQEQLLRQSGDEFILYKRWLRSGFIVRVRFHGPFNGREMRLTEWLPAPKPIYRLQLWPVNQRSAAYDAAIPTWFRLWRHQRENELGGGICFIDSPHRDTLEDLRLRLLDGVIPETLQNEEEMWRRIQSMSEPAIRSAMAALALQQLGALDRQFHEMHPNAGPVPVELKPAFDAVRHRIEQIEQTAAANPVDPELASSIARFVDEATNQAPTKPSERQPPIRDDRQ